jgi:hypothetical protein
VREAQGHVEESFVDLGHGCERHAMKWMCVESF